MSHGTKALEHKFPSWPSHGLWSIVPNNTELTKILFPHQQKKTISSKAGLEKNHKTSTQYRTLLPGQQSTFVWLYQAFHKFFFLLIHFDLHKLSENTTLKCTWSLENPGTKSCCSQKSPTQDPKHELNHTGRNNSKTRRHLQACHTLSFHNKTTKTCSRSHIKIHWNWGQQHLVLHVD